MQKYNDLQNRRFVRVFFFSFFLSFKYIRAQIATVVVTITECKIGKWLGGWPTICFCSFFLPSTFCTLVFHLNSIYVCMCRLKWSICYNCMWHSCPLKRYNIIFNRCHEWFTSNQLFNICMNKLYRSWIAIRILSIYFAWTSYHISWWLFRMTALFPSVPYFSLILPHINYLFLFK